VKNSKSTYIFGFSDRLSLTRSLSICRPNFDDLYQSTAEKLLHPVSKTNCRDIGNLFLVYNLVM